MPQNRTKQFGLSAPGISRSIVVSHPCYARMGHPKSVRVWIQNHHELRVPHIWRALCARCGRPQMHMPEALYQGMALAMPQNRTNNSGFQPLGFPARRMTEGRRPFPGALKRSPGISLVLRPAITIAKCIRCASSAGSLGLPHEQSDAPARLCAALLAAGDRLGPAHGGSGTAGSLPPAARPSYLRSCLGSNLRRPANQIVYRARHPDACRPAPSLCPPISITTGWWSPSLWWGQHFSKACAITLAPI